MENETEKIEDILRQQRQRIMDAARETHFAYWAALLSINGIFISVFSALAIFGKINIYIASVFLLASMFSCSLIIRNFLLVKDTYHILGALPEDMTPDEVKSYTNRAGNKNREKERNDKGIILLFIVQCALLFLVLFTVKLEKSSQHNLDFLERSCSHYFLESQYHIHNRRLIK